MHGYRVGGKLDKMMLYPLEELCIHSLACFVYVYRVRYAALADMAAARFDVWFCVHDMRQKFHVSYLVLPSRRKT
jgi:hypothetical protein